VFDPASDAKLPHRNEDFGRRSGVGLEALALHRVAGVRPRTVRDVLGAFGDAPLSPLRQVEADKVASRSRACNWSTCRPAVVDRRPAEGVEDDYALVRDAGRNARLPDLRRPQLDDDSGLPTTCAKRPTQRAGRCDAGDPAHRRLSPGGARRRNRSGLVDGLRHVRHVGQQQPASSTGNDPRPSIAPRSRACRTPAR